MSRATQLRDWGQREASRWAEAARRAATCTAFALAWVGAWLLAVWWLGATLVYDGAALDAASRAVSAPGAESAPESAMSLSVGVKPGRGDIDYPLDAVPRRLSGLPECPRLELSTVRGEALRFVPEARVNPAFRERLAELERLIVEVSRAEYGHAPSAVLVAASYDCRSVSGNQRRLSEHALGNAIDITGFRFDDGLTVRVDQHWRAAGEHAPHARFLRTLTQALVERGVFRTLLGPAHPDHADHFHFDMAPHAYVEL